MIEVTKQGRIFVDGVERKQYNNREYKMVKIGGVSYYVHRIVAEAYCPNDYDYPQVCHLNGIKDDNRPSNLKWVTNLQNYNNALKKGLQTKGKRKLNNKDVKSVRNIYKKDIYSYRQLAKLHNVDVKTIYSVINKKTYKHV